MCLALCMFEVQVCTMYQSKKKTLSTSRKYWWTAFEKGVGPPSNARMSSADFTATGDWLLLHVHMLEEPTAARAHLSSSAVSAAQLPTAPAHLSGPLPVSNLHLPPAQCHIDPSLVQPRLTVSQRYLHTTFTAERYLPLSSPINPDLSEPNQALVLLLLLLPRFPRFISTTTHFNNNTTHHCYSTQPLLYVWFAGAVDPQPSTRIGNSIDSNLDSPAPGCGNSAKTLRSFIGLSPPTVRYLGSPVSACPAGVRPCFFFDGRPGDLLAAVARLGKNA